MLKIVDYKGNLEAVATKLDSRKESVNKEVNEAVLKLLMILICVVMKLYLSIV